MDGVRALRSPGSTLKTFLYARALESGDYTPQTLLANVPIKYRGYRPQNFTPGEWGVVHFGEALQQSLNLPAVALNVRLGKDKDLLAFLWDAGISSLPYSRNQYGLSLVLGGGEMRLDELTTLYAALARGGVLLPTRLVMAEKDHKDHQSHQSYQGHRGHKDHEGREGHEDHDNHGGHQGHEDSYTSSGRRIISPEASFIITDILRNTPVPDYDTAARFFKGMPDVAWKTGTSSRRRDAWTIGFNPRYTVGVWVGNFSGDPVENMTGRSTGAPPDSLPL